MNSSIPLGTRVRKTRGAQWQGRVVGHYATDLTPDGVCVESERERGSVQIYPVTAVEVIPETSGPLIHDQQPESEWTFDAR